MSTVPSYSPMPPDEFVDAAPPRPSFWAQRRGASLLGIGVSVLIHLGLIGIGLLLIPAVRTAVGNLSAKQEQTIVPIAELATEHVGGIPNPGMTDNKNKAAGQDVDKTVTQSDAWGQAKSATLDRQLLAGGGDTPAAIGIGRGKSGQAKGEAKGLGQGVAGGGLARFGVPGGGSGIGPRGAVFGNGGNAYRIVFVCDGTGTMVNSYKFALLQRELRTTLAKLSPKQQYDIVFFFEGNHYEAVDPAALMPAIPANMDRVKAFFAKFSGGHQTNPIAALNFAFSLKPELVYFLSDGAFNDLATYDEVIARFDALNKDRRVRVNTILLTMADAKTQSEVEDFKQAERTMKRIAAANGGTFVSADVRTVYSSDN